MLFYNFIFAFSLLFCAHNAGAQYGALSPDPFDELDAKTGPQKSQAPEKEIMEEEYFDFPTYISLSEDMLEFGKFADGGSDSNWYIGFNNAWIVKLPPIPDGNHQRAFIGAKIGRAKTKPKKNRPWERRPIVGKVYMAISQKPAFSAEQSFFLAETSDIPLEGDDKLYYPGTGHSQWFWAEVPLPLVSTTRPNYLIIWSPTRDFKDATLSPILAAAQASPSDGENRAWNNHSLQGVPPRRETDTLQVPTNFKPALAIKLTPAPGGGVVISDFALKPRSEKLTFHFSAEGKNISLAWIEMSQDELEWRRVSTLHRTPPYFFTLNRSIVPPRGAYFRGKARDILAVEGNSTNIFVPGENVQ